MCWGSPRQTQVLEVEDALGLSELCLSSSSGKHCTINIWNGFWAINKHRIFGVIQTLIWWASYLQITIFYCLFYLFVELEGKRGFCQIQILCHEKFAAERLRTDSKFYQPRNKILNTFLEIWSCLYLLYSTQHCLGKASCRFPGL